MSHTELKDLRIAINTLCNFLFCAHKTEWAPCVFDDKNWQYDLEGILVTDDKLPDLAKQLLKDVESNENFNEYDCHGYLWKIYYQPLKK